jgi:hypothetical protein
VGLLVERGRGRARPSGGPATGSRRAQLAVALSFALPYLAVIGMYARTYERFGIPLVPFLAALAAVGCARLVSGRAAPSVALATAALALALPAAACARLAWLRARPDTLDLAAAWVAAELGRDDPVAVPPVTRMNTSFDLPLWRREDELVDADGKRIKQHSPWTRYQVAARSEGSLPVEPGYALRWLSPRTPDENRLLARDHEAFVLSMAPGHYVIEPYEARSDHALLVAMRTTLRARGELVARFTPEGPECKIEWPFFYMLSDHFNDEGLEDWPHFVPRLFRAGAIGPAVEIYRVPR